VCEGFELGGAQTGQKVFGQEGDVATKNQLAVVMGVAEWEKYPALCFDVFPDCVSGLPAA
jgi:hypothetical protein